MSVNGFSTEKDPGGLVEFLTVALPPPGHGPAAPAPGRALGRAMRPMGAGRWRGAGDGGGRGREGRSRMVGPDDDGWRCRTMVRGGAGREAVAGPVARAGPGRGSRRAEWRQERRNAGRLGMAGPAALGRPGRRGAGRPRVLGGQKRAVRCSLHVRTGDKGPAGEGAGRRGALPLAGRLGYPGRTRPPGGTGGRNPSRRQAHGRG